MNAPASPLRQSLARFRAEREADWTAFEALLARVEKRSPRSLSEEELLALPLLYRSTLSALSLARATSLDQSLVGYLESLSLRGYFYLYGAQQRGLGKRLVGFFVEDWPAAIRALWRETLVSVMLLVAGFVAGYRLVAHDRSWFSAIMPDGLAQGRGPDAAAALLRHGLYEGGEGFLSGFAAYLFTHNAQVSILAFALGFALAVPTVLLVLMNGCLLGALVQVYASKGIGFELGGWLAIHGTTELFAITLAGAAGMRIGTSVAFPGERSRMASAIAAGRVAAIAMVGVTVMLILAGLLEGIGRQTIKSDLVRYAIGGGMLSLWLGYFYLFRGVRRGEG